jgi:hypothetical protein
MLKDRAQKVLALRFGVAKRWLPQLEVEVEPHRRMERSRYTLTDIDVLTVAPSPIGGHIRLLFDCKSGARESAIARAFWLRGVMARTAANHGFVVLSSRVPISRDHRISASDLAVSLVHEDEFQDLAAGLGGTTEPIKSITCTIEAWEEFFAIGSKFPTLRDHLHFGRSAYWMVKDSGEQIRKVVAKLRAVSAELDPIKREHLCTFADSLSLFLLALSELASRLFLVLFRSKSQDEFSSTLLALLYGGYLNVEAAQKIRRLTVGSTAQDAVSIFPELERFEQLVREILQAPQQVLPAALLAREMGFASLAGAAVTGIQTDIAKESSYAPKFLLLAAEYLQRASHVPSEFGDHYSNAALNLSASALSGAGVPALLSQGTFGLSS